MKKLLQFLGLAVLLVPLLFSPASGIALYSSLTETLYMDCVSHISGGPAYRVDMELQGGALRPVPAARVHNRPQQVLLAARIVEMANTDLCENGVDPFFTTSNNSIHVNIPQVTVTGNTGEMLGTAAVNLESNLQSEFLINAAQVLDPPMVHPEARPQIVINRLEPHVEHFPAQGISFVGHCLSLEVTPTITPDNQIIMEVRVGTTQGNPVPQNLLGVSTIMAPIDNTLVLGGLTEINQFDRYDKIPILGEIPPLGYLFKVNEALSSRTELTILVTPRVVTCAE